jgi:selenocysteine lyase/cysteine desulfurase
MPNISEHKGNNMIYLDNAATSWPKPESVYQAMDEFLKSVAQELKIRGIKPSFGREDGSRFILTITK